MTAEHVEYHVDFANVLQPIMVQVQEEMRTQIEHGLTLGSAAGTDHQSPRLAGQLHSDRSDASGGAMDDDRLPRRESSVDEKSLPCRKT